MFCFVILHYKNIRETVKSIESIYVLKNIENRIIIVDNNTLNDKDYEKLMQYTNDIIKLDKNYGFSKANNIGINYAMEKYNPEFVCAMNNDCLIRTSNFYEIVKEDYKKYHFDLLGPKIQSPTGYSINPFPGYKNKNEVLEAIKQNKRLIKIYSSAILTLLLNLYIKIKHRIKKPVLLENGEKIELNVQLHGCFLIFSNKYLKKYSNAICEDTFLYYEEELMYKRIVDNNLISLYDPKILIYHEENSSLKINKKMKRLSYLNKEKFKEKSLKILYNKIQGS